MLSKRAFPLRREHVVVDDVTPTYDRLLVWETDMSVLSNPAICFEDCRNVLGAVRTLQVRMLLLYAAEMTGVDVYLEAIPFRGQKSPFSPINVPAVERMIIGLRAGQLPTMAGKMRDVIDQGTEYYRQCRRHNEGPTFMKRARYEAEEPAETLAADFVEKVLGREQFKALINPFVFENVPELLSVIALLPGHNLANFRTAEELHSVPEQPYHLAVWASVELFLSSEKPIDPYIDTDAYFSDDHLSYHFGANTLEKQWAVKFTTHSSVNWQAHRFNAFWFLNPTGLEAMVQAYYTEAEVTEESLWRFRENSILLATYTYSMEERDPIGFIRTRSQLVLKHAVESNRVVKGLAYIMNSIRGLAAEDSLTFPPVFHQVVTKHGEVPEPSIENNKVFALDPMGSFRASLSHHLYSLGDTTHIGNITLLWMLLFNVSDFVRNDRGFVILYGPPGTAKTTMVKMACSLSDRLLWSWTNSNSPRAWTGSKNGDRYTTGIHDEMITAMKSQNGNAQKGDDSGDVLLSASSTGLGSAKVLDMYDDPVTGKKIRVIDVIERFLEYFSISTTNSIGCLSSAMQDRAQLIYVPDSNVPNTNNRLVHDMVILKSQRDHAQQANPDEFRDFLHFMTRQQYVYDLLSHAGVLAQPDATLMLIMKKVIAGATLRSFLADEKTKSPRGVRDIYNIARAHCRVRVMVDLKIHRVLDVTDEDGEVHRPNIGEECRYILANNCLNMSDVIYAFTCKEAKVAVNSTMRQVTRLIKGHLLEASPYDPRKLSIDPDHYYNVKIANPNPSNTSYYNVDKSLLNAHIRGNAVKVLSEMAKIRSGPNRMLLKHNSMNGAIAIDGVLVNTVLCTEEIEFLVQVGDHIDQLMDADNELYTEEHPDTARFYCPINTEDDEYYVIRERRHIAQILNPVFKRDTDDKTRYDITFEETDTLHKLSGVAEMLKNSQVFSRPVIVPEAEARVKLRFAEDIREDPAHLPANFMIGYDEDTNTPILHDVLLISKTAIDACRRNAYPDSQCNMSTVVQILSKFIRETHLGGLPGPDGVYPMAIRPNPDLTLVSAKHGVDGAPIPLRIKNPFYVQEEARRIAHYNVPGVHLDPFDISNESIDFVYTNDAGETVYGIDPELNLDDLIVRLQYRKQFKSDDIPDIYLPSNRGAKINAQSPNQRSYSDMVRKRAEDAVLRPIGSCIG